MAKITAASNAEGSTAKRKTVSRPGMPLSGLNKRILKLALADYRAKAEGAEENPLISKAEVLGCIDKMLDIIDNKKTADAPANYAVDAPVEGV